MKWKREPLGDEFAYTFRLRKGAEYVIESSKGTLRAYHFCGCGDDRPIGPIRKTLTAALNDCKRDAKKDRAELVEFNASKL